jgi:hypothetical protein
MPLDDISFDNNRESMALPQTTSTLKSEDYVTTTMTNRQSEISALTQYASAKPQQSATPMNIKRSPFAVLDEVRSKLGL